MRPSCACSPAEHPARQDNNCLLQVFALCEALYEYDKLRVLRLPYNFLNDMAAKALARLIQAGPGPGGRLTTHPTPHTRRGAGRWVGLWAPTALQAQRTRERRSLHHGPDTTATCRPACRLCALGQYSQQVPRPGQVTGSSARLHPDAAAPPVLVCPTRCSSFSSLRPLPPAGEPRSAAAGPGRQRGDGGGRGGAGGGAGATGRRAAGGAAGGDSVA